MNKFFDPNSLVSLVGKPQKNGVKTPQEQKAPLVDLIPGQLARRELNFVNEKLKTVTGKIGKQQ